MKTLISPNTIKLWLSAKDTYLWAKNLSNLGHCTRWPCSTLADKRVFAEFDRNGLVALAINGNSDTDCDSTELSAICSDYLRTCRKLSAEHPAYLCAVAQFNQ